MANTDAPLHEPLVRQLDLLGDFQHLPEKTKATFWVVLEYVFDRLVRVDAGSFFASGVAGVCSTLPAYLLIR